MADEAPQNPFAGPSAIRHLDFETGRRQAYEPPPGDVASEPVFAARGPTEGEGWITTVVILDALDIGAGPVATVEVPRRMAFGSRGQWLPQ